MTQGLFLYLTSRLRFFHLCLFIFFLRFLMILDMRSSGAWGREVNMKGAKISAVDARMVPLNDDSCVIPNVTTLGFKSGVNAVGMFRIISFWGNVDTQRELA